MSRKDGELFDKMRKEYPYDDDVLSKTLTDICCDFMRHKKEYNFNIVLYS